MPGTCSGACMCELHLHCRKPPKSAAREYARWLAYMRKQDANFIDDDE